VQRIQKKYGRDKFEVVLVSIDLGYGETYGNVRRSVERTMARYKVDWPSIIEPDGWNGTMRRFNVGGYDPILVDPNGIVRKVNVRGRELDGLLESILRVAAK
jgi:hypothetical protein